MPKGHKLYPWTYFCPDCGSSHGRGKGPYGLGMHYCVNGWTGPSPAPFARVRKEPKKVAKKCRAVVSEKWNGNRVRQCRNGIQPDETYCWKHR